MERSPLRIEPGLDGASVTIRVVRDHGPRLPIAFVVELLVAILVGFTLSVWAGIVLFMLGFVAVGIMLRPTAPPVVVFEVDVQGPKQAGQPVEVRADFQHLWIGGERHTIAGGLTRKEHARLMGLIEGRERGSADEVPRELGALGRSRELP